MDLFSQTISVPVAYNGIAFVSASGHYDYFYVQNKATTPGFEITVWVGDYAVADSNFQVGPGESLELPAGTRKLLIASDANGPHDVLVISTDPDYTVV